jgi:hypothetical protein
MTLVSASSATGVATIPSGTYTFAGLGLNQTFSGTNIFSGAAAPSPTSGQASFGGSSSFGAVIIGNGTNDVTLENRNGSNVCNIGGNTTQFNCNTLALTNALGVASGGTGNATATAHSIPVSEGTSAQASVGPCATNQAILGKGASADPTCGAVRTQLTANINYYVNGNSGGTATCGSAGGSTCSAGNDSNNCLTPGTACLTLQHVVNVVVGTIDMAQQFNATVFLAHNTGTTNYDLFCGFGPFIGTSVINVAGDSTSQTATVITDPAGAYGLQIKDGCTIDYSYVKFVDNPSNNAAGHIAVGGTGNAGHLDIANVTFGPLTIGTMLSAGNMGSATLVGPITIAGGAPLAIGSGNGGLIDFGSQTVTLTGTPAFSTAFAYMPASGIIGATTTTFSGSATGPRCIVAGPLNLAGFNPNAVFPGSTDCVANEYVGAIGLQTGSGGSSSFAYGSSGQPLISGGGSNANNTWATAAQMQAFTEQGMTLLNVLTASNSANLSDTTSFTSTYDDYLIVFDAIVPVTNAVNFNCQIKSGGAFQTTGYLNITGGATSYVDLMSGASTLINNAGYGWSGQAYLQSASSTGFKPFTARNNLWWSGTATIGGNSNVVGAWTGGTGAITGLQCQMSSGNISTGNIKIFGLRIAQ